MRLTVRAERWPIAGAFVIARGAKTEAAVVVAEIADGPFSGRGECTPYPRYGETVEGVVGQIEGLRAAVETGLTRETLQGLLPPGAARNALDCALWDLEAARAGTSAWALAGIPALQPVETCYTISLGEPDAMAAAARAAAGRPLLKLKIGGRGDLERIAAVHAAAPHARLVVDANESLTFEGLADLAPRLRALGVVLIEQPLPVGEDGPLDVYRSPIPLCADESLHTRAELTHCSSRYQAVNIKLDKAGGLTEALALKAEAQALGLKIMAGCMVATSLAMAPALLIAQGAAFTDLDGPLLLARDREGGLSFQGSSILPPPPGLWGMSPA